MSNRASLDHIYRTVWNSALGAMVAVGGGRALLWSAVAPPLRLGALSLAIAVGWTAAPSVAFANPEGGVVIVGTANMASTGNRLVVTTQNGAGTNYSAINWQSFSIPAGSTTHFQQPNAASTSINRVVTNTPSQLFGTLSSNGNLVLVNQAGIAVGSGAVVDTAGFTASALRMSDADALAGRLRFGDGSTATSGVSVQGRILARSGDVVLIGSSVNTGSEALIEAPNGSTILAAGQKVELTGRGLEGIYLQVQAPTDSAVNLGTLKAGAVGVFAGTLRHSGVIQATAATLEGGKVVLKATGDTYVEGDGKIVATGVRGGFVDILGQRVALLDTASIDVSGDLSGGSVRIGGDYQGKNTNVQNASMTYVGAKTVVNADAVATGNGGRVIVWANDTTRAYGNISARGGVGGGDGGFVETSGARSLEITGALVDTRASKGRSGKWLLDPMTITLVSGVGTDNFGAGTFVGTPWLLSGGVGGATIYGATLLSALNTSDVILTTDYALGGGNINFTAGTYNFGAAAAANSLTLLARGGVTGATGNIALPAGTYITMKPGANLTLVAGWDGVSTLTPAVTAAMGSGRGGISLSGDASITAPGGMIRMAAGFDGITNNLGSGTLTALTLKIVSEGSVSLAGLNAVGTLAASVTGASSSFGYESAAGFTVGTVDGLNGVKTNGGNITMRGYSSGVLQINKDVDAGGGAVLIGQASGSGGSTASINVGSTETISGGSVQLYTSDNASTITSSGTVSSTGGGITLTAPGGVTTGTVSSSGGTIGVTASAGSVSLSGAVSAGTGIFNLSGLTGISQSAAITAGTLNLTNGTGGVTLGGANSVSNVSLSGTGGAISFNDIKPNYSLTVVTISNLNFTGTGILNVGGWTSAGNVSLASNGGISATGIVATGTLGLSTSNSAISASGIVTAGGATTINAGTGSVTMTNTSNNFTTLGITGGVVSLVDNNALTVTSGSGSSMSLSSFGGALTVAGSIATTGNITLSGYSGVTLNGAGVSSSAGTVALTSSFGGIGVNSGSYLSGPNITLNSVSGSTVNASTLKPGGIGGIGAVSVTGNLTLQGGSTIAIDVASTSSFDTVSVTGVYNAASASETLSVSDLSGGTTSGALSSATISASSLGGSPMVLSGPAGWTKAQTATNISLTAVAAVAAVAAVTTSNQQPLRGGSADFLNQFARLLLGQQDSGSDRQKSKDLLLVEGEICRP